MGLRIEDGTGQGYTVAVNALNQLKVVASDITQLDSRSISGHGYNVNTGVITLTSAAESGILYVQNTGTEYLVIDSMLISVGDSNAGAAVDVIVRNYRNPDAGTLISGGSAVSAVNRNFGSSLPATITAKIGTTGSTITSGTVVSARLVHDSTQTDATIGWILPAGTAFATSIQPPAGNTSMQVFITASMYFINEDEV
jgi:hypothetical protein